jgi:ABC-type cobalamin/Fe3+-siderophores transport system ATPase subunit
MEDWLVYVIGYPGCGKTTAMQKAIGMDNVLEQDTLLQKKPFAHTVYPSGIVELGRQRDTYGGTDSLALNVQPAVVKWLRDIDAPVVVGEGDRLANYKFFNSVALMGRSLAIVHIKCGELTARKRAWERGSRFNESWLKGRISKVDSLVQTCQQINVLHTLDGNANIDDVAQGLSDIIEGLNG